MKKNPLICIMHIAECIENIKVYTQGINLINS